MPSRRDILKAAVALPLALAARRARAFGDSTKLVFAQVRTGGLWNPHPTALRRFAWEIEKRTSIDPAVEPVPVSLADPDLFKAPFCVLTGDDAFPAFTDAEAGNLRRLLQYGGFLLVDDASAHPGGPFDESVRRELRALFPASPLARVPREHVLYKTFYLLDGPSGRAQAAPFLEAIELGGRLAVVYSQNDLLGAMARDSFGNWELDVVPGGEAQREQAFRLGINLAMYALCLDYKEDQVHVPFIMKRRRI